MIVFQICHLWRTLEHIFLLRKGCVLCVALYCQCKFIFKSHSRNPYSPLFLDRIILLYVNICLSLVNINFIDWVWVRLNYCIYKNLMYWNLKKKSYSNILLVSHWFSAKAGFVSFLSKRHFLVCLDIFSHHNLRKVLLSQLSFSVQRIGCWITQDSPHSPKLSSTQCQQNYNLESMK